MELPIQLKKLYRHWRFHTNMETSLDLEVVITDQELSKNISWFIHERIDIWKRKMNNPEKTPYTNDPILSEYKFCNILREFDRQTIEFHTLLNPYRNDFAFWLLNMFYCRLVARTSTIVSTGFLSFDKSNNKDIYEKLMHVARPRFGTPYVFPVSVILKSVTPTRELFITEYVPWVMKQIAMVISTGKKKSVYDGLQEIIPIFGYNLYFLWTEVLIDTAYQFPEYIDLYGQFPIGPGSLPTMKRIDSSKDSTLLVKDLARTVLDIHLTYEGNKLVLSAENWEGIGCEYRKYTNLKNGIGRKRLFRIKV